MQYILEYNQFINESKFKYINKDTFSINNQIYTINEFIRMRDIDAKKLSKKDIHDIRTPINVIIGYMQLLETDPSSKNKKDAAKFITDAVTKFNNILSGTPKQKPYTKSKKLSPLSKYKQGD